MNGFALHTPSGHHDGWRWAGSAVAVIAIHAGLIAAGIALYHRDQPPGVTTPAILVDMAPAAAAPELQPQDVAPGPEMQQAEAPSEPPPEPVAPQPADEAVPPTPQVENPVVEAPPEQKTEPTPMPPEQTKVPPEPPKPIAETPKPTPARKEARKKPSDTPPAPQTSAAPRADRQAARPAAAASSGAAAAAALPSYRDRLAAHLQRYKQYPSEAKSLGRQGVAMLSFTVSRSGQVLASRLASSSGVPALDAETMAMIRRAQPLPSFPPEMAQASLSFTVPVRFSIR